MYSVRKANTTYSSLCLTDVPGALKTSKPANFSLMRGTLPKRVSMAQVAFFHLNVDFEIYTHVGERNNFKFGQSVKAVDRHVTILAVYCIQSSLRGAGDSSI